MCVADSSSCSMTNFRLMLPHVTVNFRLLLPHFTVNFRLSLPHLTVNFRLLLPHLTVNFRSLLPHLTVNFRSLLPHLTINFRLLLTHLTVNFRLMYFSTFQCTSNQLIRSKGKSRTVLHIILSTKSVFFISIFWGGGSNPAPSPPSRLVARLLDCELRCSAAPLDPTLANRPLLTTPLARHCTPYARWPGYSRQPPPADHTFGQALYAVCTVARLLSPTAPC